MSDDTGAVAHGLDGCPEWIGRYPSRVAGDHLAFHNQQRKGAQQSILAEILIICVFWLVCSDCFPHRLELRLRSDHCGSMADL